jgi:glycosyltransferase involved in cell wall biosynthesis
LQLAIVVQRYGTEITGGAELHARLIAERLAARHDVTVLTTCALDYVTWRNEYPRGLSVVDGIPVFRFPVRRARDPRRFGRLQQRVFHREHSERDALAWMHAQGPYSPRLRRWVRSHRDDFDYVICFSYRYWTTFFAMQEVAGKGILVPTAEPDPAVEMPLFHDTFRSARAIMYNSHEERDMIVAQAANDDVPGVIVGVGIVEPPPVDPARFRAERRIDEPFLLYIGRIDANKGCEQLFDYYQRAYAAIRADGGTPPRLVLAGSAILEIPDHPGISYLGRVSEQEKYDALAACTALVMPSFYESLSMVLLEAWALSRPVLVNAHCDVLHGQARRANGGLWYANTGEFIESMRLLGDDRELGDSLGAAGQRYYDANYTWPVIEDKYETMLQQLAEEDRA